ncbi:hypothetical protein ACQP2Y_33580 [Actinoplanes sp. CA-051413]|uniref:hypothetical protein n=1 Tax=Actinoplanes sp. CA-051413 TaxID=3239899 RepID=UPI003D96FACD
MTISAVRTRPWPFTRHLLEMLAAMVVGMVALGPFWTPSRVDVSALWMATTMSVAMAVWMGYRGHSGAAIAEMTAAMYAPFLLLLIPWWAGLIPSPAVLLGGHLLMLPAMALAMLHRADEYAGGHVHEPRTGLLARWPTALALLITVDMLVEPAALAPWKLLVLAFAYLTIGAVRRTLRPRAVLIRQVAAMGVYLGLLLATVLAGPVLSVWLVGLGWLAHAGWDYWHFRRNEVVPRPFAEWCGVVDAVIGVSVLVYAVTL